MISRQSNQPAITPRKIDSDIKTLFDRDNRSPPTTSSILTCRYDRYQYFSLSSGKDSSIYLGKTDDEYFILIKRKLFTSASNYSNSQIEAVFHAVDQEEVLRILSTKVPLQFPPLIDTRKYKESGSWITFWKSTTYYADFLFKVKECNLLSQYLKEKAQEGIGKDAFQLLCNLASFLAKIEEMKFPIGYMKLPYCLVGKADDEDHKRELILVSAGILDRFLEKRKEDPESVNKENVKLLFTLFCQIACKQGEPLTFQQYIKEFNILYSKEDYEEIGLYESRITEAMEKCLSTGKGTSITSQEFLELIQSILGLRQAQEIAVIATTDFDDSHHYNTPKVREPQIGAEAALLQKYSSCIRLTLCIGFIVGILVLLYIFVLQGYLKQGKDSQIQTYQANIQQSSLSLNTMTAKMAALIKQVNGTLYDPNANSTGDQLEDQAQNLLNAFQAVANVYNQTITNQQNQINALQNMRNQNAIQLLNAPQIILNQSASMSNDNQTTASLISNLTSLNQTNTTLTQQVVPLNQTAQNITAQVTTAQNINAALLANISAKNAIIQNQVLGFYSSILDILNTSQINNTIYRILQLNLIDDFILTSDGGFLITGAVYNTSTSARLMNAVVIKTNSTGDIQWQYTNVSTVGGRKTALYCKHFRWKLYGLGLY